MSHQPNASQAGNYDDLLIGLGSDDMNDFGLDDEEDEDVDTLTPPPKDGARNAGRGIDVFDDFGISPDPFDSSSVPTFEGFKTGKGAKIAPSSSEALERARKRFELEEVDSDPEPKQGRDQKRSRIEDNEDDELDEPTLEDIPPPEFVMSESMGFVNGRGRAVAPPSETAMQKALQILSAVEEEADTLVSQATPTAAPRQMSAFTTGSGNAVAGPSRLAMTNASRLLDDSDQPNDSVDSLPASDNLSTPVKSVAKPRGDFDDARRKALSIFGEDDLGTPTTTRGSMLPPVTSTPFRPLVAPAPTSTPRPPSAMPFAPPSSTAFRTPLRPTTNTFTQPQSQYQSYPSPIPRSAIKHPAPIQIKTPTSSKRINVGLTPARNRTKKTFVTPFKGGSKLAGSPLNKITNTPRTSFLPVKSFPQEPKPAMISPPVFDLTMPKNRKNAKDAYLHPQYTTHEELKEMGLPDEIWQLDLQNALQYQFIAEDATVLNNVHAFKILQMDGCHFATQKWVSNHWSLILWKLAGQVQAKPALYVQKWNWGEIISQLKYRYEREYGQAQRPIIRRIQEHDSSASLPMILCVAGVQWTHQPTEVGEEPAPPRPYLELTDGWYKIVAEVDECLARAVQRGVIATGRKLAISGAKLDSGSEGAEVLEAFDKSRLIISGNSTSLARWHAKMGPQPEPFIAGLSSLSVDGGQIMLMDIIIEKLFPIAYINASKGSREGPWNEDEERVRADQWREKYQAESTSLREKLSKRLEGIEDLVETLVSAAQDVEDPVESTPPDNLEKEFDDMLKARGSSARIRQLSGGHLIHLARYARGRMEQEISEGHAEIEGELQSSCPVREVRDFRMARVSDARDGYKETARFGMLNIWDVKSLGHDTIREGGRYLVSNLMPGRQGDWSVPRMGGGLREIYLHTRRDTRWKEVGGNGSGSGRDD